MIRATDNWSFFYWQRRALSAEFHALTGGKEHMPNAGGNGTAPGKDVHSRRTRRNRRKATRS